MYWVPIQTRKAYRYFRNNFVSEVFINNLNSESKYCYLKIKCLPSQRVSSKQYHVCTLLKKNHADEAGGEIISAYCVCVKRITPCNCLCSSSSSCFSASVIRNIREFGSKNCFYRPSNSTKRGFRDSFPLIKIFDCY